MYAVPAYVVGVVAYVVGFAYVVGVAYVVGFAVQCCSLLNCKHLLNIRHGISVYLQESSALKEIPVVVMSSENVPHRINR
jgi:hypothetical protein